MNRTLLIAYGNPSRQDDGLAYHILFELRARLGLEPIALDDLDDGPLLPGLEICCTQQLVPEMAEMLAEMDTVVFIDAHVPGTQWQPVHWQQIAPENSPSMVSHHFKPQVLLAWSLALYQKAPQAYTLSVLGTAFDFGSDLDSETAERVHHAVDILIAQLQLPLGQGKAQ